MTILHQMHQLIIDYGCYNCVDFADKYEQIDKNIFYLRNSISPNYTTKF